MSTRLAERLGARVLLGFVGGVSWAAWGTRPRAARRAAVLGDFAAAVGPRALKPMAYVEKDWTADRWTRGGPVSALGPGVLSGFGSFLTRPFNRVHWAGAETATYWNGCMDGAVSSGERAAREAALMARHLYRLGGGAHDRRRPVVIAWAALDGHGARGRRVQAKNHAHRGRPRGAVGSEKVGHGAGGRR